MRTERGREEERVKAFLNRVETSTKHEEARPVSRRGLLQTQAASANSLLGWGGAECVPEAVGSGRRGEGEGRGGKLGQKHRWRHFMYCLGENKTKCFI